MEVSQAVQELERKYQEMRTRAEKAEGLIRVYEARDGVRTIARDADMDDKWQIHWRVGEEEPVSFTFAPGLWLLGVAEGFLRNPQPFEISIDPVPTQERTEGE